MQNNKIQSLIDEKVISLGNVMELTLGSRSDSRESPFTVQVMYNN